MALGLEAGTHATIVLHQYLTLISKHYNQQCKVIGELELLISLETETHEYL